MLEREEAEDIFDSIIETVCNEWESGLRRAGVSVAECEQLERAFVYEGLFFEGD